MLFRFESEIPPGEVLKLKVEINCREHKPVYKLEKRHFEILSSWYRGECDITTYRVEELLGTKLRALYQRKKGRDLYDIYRSLAADHLINRDEIIKAYREYMRQEPNGVPSREFYLRNLEAKIFDREFLEDTAALLRPDELYDPQEGFHMVKKELIGLM